MPNLKDLLESFLGSGPAQPQPQIDQARPWDSQFLQQTVQPAPQPAQAQPAQAADPWVLIQQLVERQKAAERLASPVSPILEAVPGSIRR